MAESFYVRWPASAGGSGGVSSLNTLTGALTIAAGTGITVTASGGNTLTIASTDQSTLTFSDSLVNTAGNVTLVNDTATPGDSQYYGTNSGGTLGYFNLPVGFVNPMTTLGDIIYGGVSGAATRLAGNTTSTREFYTSTGSGGNAAAPTLGVLQSGDIPNNVANTSGSAGSVSGTNVITNSNLAQMGAGTIKGNNTGSTANAADLTATQVTAMLNLFATGATTQGLVPGSNSVGSTYFLNGAGSWAVPVGTTYTFADSVSNSGGTVTLSGDSASPGNSYFYGTNGSGTKGWYLQSAISPTFSGLTQYGIIYAATNSTLASSSTGTSGYYMTSNGSGGPPSYQQVTLNNATVTGVLPIANGGTDNGSLAVTAGGVLYTDGTKFQNVGAGTAGQILQSNAASAPIWVSVVGAGTTFFASSQVTTTSSAVTSSTFTTFSNSPAFTFTPGITGTYRVYCGATILNGNNNGTAAIQIINTSGGATLLYTSQGGVGFNSAALTDQVASTVFVQSVYTLAAGTSYVFDIQGATTNGTNLYLTGLNTQSPTGAPFYMFAEAINPNYSISSSLIGGMVTYGIYY